MMDGLPYFSYSHRSDDGIQLGWKKHTTFRFTIVQWKIDDDVPIGLGIKEVCTPSHDEKKSSLSVDQQRVSP
ncbi:hypothetical protein TNCV_4437281 [Trichonephila clavipes]|nr:hypothetical protein TNCV_4437281 [Trichonephila clavipes]